MTNNCSITIFLDKRRKKIDGSYPVKLRVFTQHPRIQKLYPTAFNLTESEFERTWNATRPRSEDKTIKMELQALLSGAENIAKTMPHFSFEIFEKKLSMRKGDEINLAYLYQEAIDKRMKRGEIGSAGNYQYAKRSLEIFQNKNKSLPFTKLSLIDINKDWLDDFDRFMNKEGKSPTTVSMYIRTFRTIFNEAIAAGNVQRELYPFGKGKYQPPSARKVKKALTREEVKRLFMSEPGTPEQAKAKDFWFFSYALNGMNFKDIANLKHKDIRNDKIEFFRAKTIQTSKTNLKPITVFMNDYTKNVISKYSLTIGKSDGFIFDIIKPGQDPIVINSSIKNFIKFVNQHIKKLCLANDITTEVSTYWARHTFATLAVRNGATLEFIQESLGHGDLKTTQGYFAGFDNDAKKEFAGKIMNF